MKIRSRIGIAIGLAAFIPAAMLAEQGIVTLWGSGSVTLSTNEVATFKTYFDSYHGYNGQITIGLGTNNYTFFNPRKLFVEGFNVGFTTPVKLRELTIAGPATISLDGGGLVTLDIQPTPTPPEKTAVVAAYSGHVKVTMETSTDLVNWAPVPDGVTYTNSPDARFLRIRMEKVSSP